MKKIIIVFDGTHYSEGVFSFIIELNKISPLSVTGVFLSPMDYTSIWTYPIIPGSSGAYLSMPSEAEKSEIKLQENIRRFEHNCTANNILFKVHNDANGLVFEELQKESRYADLLVLSSELFYENIGKQPNDYMKEVLHTSECAVLLLPEKIQFPQNIILSYDGSASSVFAIKQFAYIFPELCNRKSILVYIDPQAKTMPGQDYMEELALRHFPDLTLHVLETDAQKDFTAWLANQPNPIVITGAYSRPGISQLFRKSFMTELIKKHSTPIFIAHK
jgi:hypothetical protein